MYSSSFSCAWMENACSFPMKDEEKEKKNHNGVSTGRECDDVGDVKVLKKEQ